MPTCSTTVSDGFGSGTGIRRWVRTIVVFVMFAALIGAAPPARAADTLPLLWEAGGLDAGSTGAGQAARIATDSNGNIAVVSGPSGGRNLAVTSYSSAGAFRWRASSTPLTGTFVGDWVATAPNGDVVAVGRNTSSSGSPIAITMVRYNSAGALQWRVDINQTLPSVGRLLVDAEGNVYLAFNSLGDGQDIRVYKYSPAGAVLWSQTIATGSLANDIATSLALSPDGTDVVVSGNVSGGATWITAAFDTSTGTRRWLTTAAEGIAARDVVVDAGRVYVTGQGNIGITAYLTVVAYDRSTGARLWRTDTKPVDGTGAAGLRIALGADGNVVATGQASRGFLDWYTVSFTTTGAVRWQAVRDGGLNTDEIPSAVVAMANGTIVVTGKGGPNLPGGFIPGVTVGYSVDGGLLWEGFAPFATVWATALPNGDLCTTGGYDAYVSCFRPPGSGNVAPVAVATATPQSGASPLTVTFDASASSDADGTVTSFAWVFGDGATASGATVGHVYSAAGTYTASVTVTDDAGATDSASVVVTVSGSGSIHVADLDATAVPAGRSWTATVTITIRDDAGAAVSGATVTGAWTRGAAATCTTAATGACSVQATSKARSETFTVSVVTRTPFAYNPAANTDPDGDSNGTVITVTKPPR